jgi:predicted NAD-dependent protein-ADP-ribosyltransferase YbiA (DUF1768 family)
MKNRITSFSGDFRFLSNFWECRIWLFDMFFSTTEAAYVAAKLPEHLSGLREKIASLPPGKAKRFGRGEDIFKDGTAKFVLRSDWDSNMRLATMRILLAQKFCPIQNPGLAEMLISTGNAEIIEGNTWGDTFFGVCNGVGKNHLGRLLMERRAELFSQARLMQAYVLAAPLKRQNSATEDFKSLYTFYRGLNIPESS